MGQSICSLIRVSQITGIVLERRYGLWKRERERETDRQQTDRQTDRERDLQPVCIILFAETKKINSQTLHAHDCRMAIVYMT